MSYLDKQSQDQSLNGIITISDGVCSISDGQISGVSSLDIEGDATINGSLTVSGQIKGDIDLVIQNTNSTGYSNNHKNNTQYMQCSKGNFAKIKANSVVTNEGFIRKSFTNQFVITQEKTPLSTNDDGIYGQMAFDSNYIYIYTSLGWKRASLVTFQA